MISTGFLVPLTVAEPSQVRPAVSPARRAVVLWVPSVLLGSILGARALRKDGGSLIRPRLGTPARSVISFVINNIQGPHRERVPFHAADCLGMVCHRPYGPRLKALQIAGVHVQLIKANLGGVGRGGTALQTNPRRTPYMFSKC